MPESDALTIARWLVHERGFSVIPIDHPAETTQTDPKRIGKVPVLPSWKAFQTARATDDNLQAWFGNGRRRNVAIVTGAVSGVVAIDCDSPEARAWADSQLPPTRMITVTAGGQDNSRRSAVRSTRCRTAGARAPGNRARQVSAGSGLRPEDVDLHALGILPELLELAQIRRVTAADARDDCGIRYRSDDLLDARRHPQRPAA